MTKDQNIVLTLDNSLLPSLPQKWCNLVNRPLSLISQKAYRTGIKRIRNKSIVFTGCIRDINPQILNENIRKLRILSSLFSSSVFVFVINDTKVTLPKDFIALEYTYGIPPLGGGRDERRVRWMSIFRNCYLEYIRANLNDYDYLCVIDMDIRDWSMNGLVSSFGYSGWNCISSNGVQHIENDRMVYYDSFSFADLNYNVHDNIEVFEKDQLINSISGFGGLEIFKMNKIQGKYSGMKFNGKFLCEHSGLNFSTGGHFINTNQLVLR